MAALTRVVQGYRPDNEAIYWSSGLGLDTWLNNLTLKITPTRFGLVTPSSGSPLSMLAKVTLVKIVNYGTSVCD